MLCVHTAKPPLTCFCRKKEIFDFIGDSNISPPASELRVNPALSKLLSALNHGSTTCEQSCKLILGQQKAKDRRKLAQFSSKLPAEIAHKYKRDLWRLSGSIAPIVAAPCHIPFVRRAAVVVARGINKFP